MFSNLIDKLLFNSYKAELDSATDEVVARYSRGSIALQLKRFLMLADAETLHIKGDRAAKRLAKRVGRAS